MLSASSRATGEVDLFQSVFPPAIFCFEQHVACFWGGADEEERVMGSHSTEYGGPVGDPIKGGRILFHYVVVGGDGCFVVVT